MAFYFVVVVAGEGNVEIQLLARLFTTLQFYLFSFFFKFSSCFSGQASGQYFYRHHFFFFWLETCL
jgi:hypothetical protein